MASIAVFFKRSVLNHTTYVCKKRNGQCLVDVETRSNCAYCRFQKCLQQNMQRERAKAKQSANHLEETVNDAAENREQTTVSA